MIIICPACTARFVVKAEAIGASGRKVKCAKCQESWFQAPDDSALEAAKVAVPEPEALEPIKSGANVPAIKKTGVPLYFKLAFAAVVVLFIVVVSIVISGSVLPSMSSYYGMFGIYDSKEIALSDLKVEKVESGQYQDLVISGKIVNKSANSKKLPDLRLTIYDESHDKLKSVTLASEGADIAAGQSTDFENRIPRMPTKASVVVVDLGNGLDLMWR